jgi:hypothetical protein
MSNTLNHVRTPRKQLSDQLDRLDVILDGLADALNQSVADAVRDVVGQVVREAVEGTIKEVLGNPELLRAALAAHNQPAAVEPNPTPPQRPHFEAARNALAALAQKARQAAAVARSKVGTAWNWALARVRAAARLAADTGSTLWRHRSNCAVALASGLITGVAVYHAGPAVAGVLCGLGSTALTAAGLILYPLWRLLRGGSPA